MKAQVTYPCSECGRRFLASEMTQIAGRWVCTDCKSVLLQKLLEKGSIGQTVKYAGFWIRFAAIFLDGLILIIDYSIFIIIFSLIIILVIPGIASARGFFIGLMQILSIFIVVFYETFMIGKYGATLGKMVCKLKVVGVKKIGEFS